MPSPTTAHDFTIRLISFSDDDIAAETAGVLDLIDTNTIGVVQVISRLMHDHPAIGSMFGQVPRGHVALHARFVTERNSVNLFFVRPKSWWTSLMPAHLLLSTPDNLSTLTGKANFVEPDLPLTEHEVRRHATELIDSWTQHRNQKQRTRQLLARARELGSGNHTALDHAIRELNASRGRPSAKQRAVIIDALKTILPETP